MKVGVIGASEMAGSAIYKLAKQNLRNRCNRDC